MLLLDTSAAVALREGQADVGNRIAVLARLPLLSIISVIELEGGGVAAHEGAAKRREALDLLYESLEVLEFGHKEASAYQRIITATGFSRAKIIDRMIAAQAIVAGAALATLNPRDFRDIPGLQIEDWS